MAPLPAGAQGWTLSAEFSGLVDCVVRNGAFVTVLGRIFSEIPFLIPLGVAPSEPAGAQGWALSAKFLDSFDFVFETVVFDRGEW